MCSLLRGVGVELERPGHELAVAELEEIPGRAAVQRIGRDETMREVLPDEVLDRLPRRPVPRRRRRPGEQDPLEIPNIRRPLHLTGETAAAAVRDPDPVRPHPFRPALEVIPRETADGAVVADAERLTIEAPRPRAQRHPPAVRHARNRDVRHQYPRGSVPLRVEVPRMNTAVDDGNAGTASSPRTTSCDTCPSIVCAIDST